MSMNINLNLLNRCVFIVCSFISTQPQLDIISSWLRELLAEPWWIVKHTASAVTPTSLTIPEWIISIENTILIMNALYYQYHRSSPGPQKRESLDQCRERLIECMDKYLVYVILFHQQLLQKSRCVSLVSVHV